MLAMASNRTYGLNLDAGETMQPQPFSLVGDGAGSIFKIFTTAAALDMGMGINAQLDAPSRFEAKGLGSGGAKGCPPATWCVQNAGNYRGQMNVTDALATSPNTAFAKLISQVGVQRTVDMAVKLGLRSYALPGTARDYDPESNESLADFVKRQNLGSFTLGPIEVNPLELSNVAATLGSGGVVVPAQPDRQGLRPPRHRGVGHHRNLRTGGSRGAGQHAGQRDEQGRPGPGTAAGSAGSAGWNLPMSGKTGHHRGAPVVGLPGLHQHTTRPPTTSTTTPPTPSDLCSFPLRQCGSGNLFGGNEPARTWFTAMKPIANNFGPVRAAADRSALRRRGAGLEGAQRVGHDPGPGAAAAEGGRLPGRRPGQLRQQHCASRRGGRHVAQRPDGSRLDHHPPDQQRHPAATAAAAGRACRSRAFRPRSARRSSRSPACRRSLFRCSGRRHRLRRHPRDRCGRG